MLRSLLLACAACRISLASAPFVGAYVFVQGPGGLAKLQALAASASTPPSIPVTRLFLAFASPTLIYVNGSRTLNGTGLELASGGDAGFAAAAAAIATLAAANVTTFVSMGGWDGNCFPYAYTRYSVAGYGPNTPNYWKVTEYCGGDVDTAGPANEYCYTCEPPSANESLFNFNMFPEPAYSPTWAAAVAYVAAGAGGAHAPAWDPSLINGENWTDPATGVTTTVPGSGAPYALRRDPYADVVSLAADLGCGGVDLDYEEMWHADEYKYGPAGGPWTLEQTVYKWAAIARDMQLSIAARAPGMLLSTAAGAASGWAGDWWGGNLKGLLLQAKGWYPELVDFIAAGGGVNVMTYDLSDNEAHYECPTPDVCTLHDQVEFYMAQYAAAGIDANVGYEIGTPAYPDPVEDPAHQLPLTRSELATIVSVTQAKHAGAIIWEAFKRPGVDGQATASDAAQTVCRAVLPPGTPRCAGNLPDAPPTDAPARGGRR